MTTAMTKIMLPELFECFSIDHDDGGDGDDDSHGDNDDDDDDDTNKH